MQKTADLIFFAFVIPDESEVLTNSDAGLADEFGKFQSCRSPEKLVQQLGLGICRVQLLDDFFQFGCVGLATTGLK